MSSREFSEWMAYAQLEPFGEQRADLRAGIVASTVAAGYTKKGHRPPKPTVFMPKFDKDAPPDEDQLADKVVSAFAAFNPQDLRDQPEPEFISTLEELRGGDSW